MYHKLLCDVRFLTTMRRFDEDLAEQGRVDPCVRCGGPLDADDYPRKPHGLPPGVGEAYADRFSFTCRDCRKRRTPPSVRFFGCRWYVAPVFLLVNAMRDGITEKRAVELRELLGASLSIRTLYRWREWWHEIFVSTPFWRVRRGRLSPPPPEGDLPASLLERFAGALSEKLTALLRFLSPLTAPNSPMDA